MKSGCIYQSDSVYAISSIINSDLLKLGTVLYDLYDWIDNLTMPEMRKVLKSITFEEKSVTILKKD